MSKYLIFSDLHASYNSSIMPLYCEESKYTTRLQMIIDTLKWIFEIAQKENVDKIIFGGDWFDSHTVRSEELTAVTEAMSYYNNEIPFIVITGNHDILDNNNDFYSSSILKNYESIQVYDKPTKIDNELSVLPYMKPQDIDYDLLQSISNKILISHIDLRGSHLRPDYQMETGVDPELFAMNFERTFNGHIHTAEELTPSVMNVGNCCSNSFSDSNSYIHGCIIFDSENNKYVRYYNPYTILFRSLSVNSLSEFISYTKKLMSYKYILKIKVDSDLKNDIKNYIDSSCNNIIACKFICNFKLRNMDDSLKLQIDSDSIVQDFVNFLESGEVNLKSNIKYYKDIMERI